MFGTHIFSLEFGMYFFSSGFLPFFEFREYMFDFAVSIAYNCNNLKHNDIKNIQRHFIFLSHLVLWTFIPSLTNLNLPLDTMTL